MVIATNPLHNVPNFFSIVCVLRNGRYPEEFGTTRTLKHAFRGRNMTGKPHSIFDAVKYAVLEDEPEQSHTPSAVSPTQTAYVAPPTHSAVTSESFEVAQEVNPPVHPIDSGTVPDDDSAYQRLLTKTNFEATDAASTIHKFLDPLKAIPDAVMPPNIKFKTAVVQAGAQAGLSEESGFAAFHPPQTQLQQKEDAFAAKARQIE